MYSSVLENLSISLWKTSCHRQYFGWNIWNFQNNDHLKPEKCIPDSSNRLGNTVFRVSSPWTYYIEGNFRFKLDLFKSILSNKKKLIVKEKTTAIFNCKYQSKLFNPWNFFLNVNTMSTTVSYESVLCHAMT